MEILSIDQPFSSFQYCDKKFQGLNTSRRLFSLARSAGARTLLFERIEPDGIIESENEEIRSMHPNYIMGGLARLTFWDVEFDNLEDLSNLHDENLCGYAILKRDIIDSHKIDRWHIFESVFQKYDHPHNCVPQPRRYTIAVGGKEYQIPGVMYCQQNAINKACAQVALRSILSKNVQPKSITYNNINDISRSVDPDFNPSDGLSTQQIRAVLKHYEVQFIDFDYNQMEQYEDSHFKNCRRVFPYHKFVYSGVESGAGALLGFKLSGPGLQLPQRHIIPFYGHTFNKDTWAPDADLSYFKVGENFGYIPSESWTSSFLGHDDNFGSNFCVPRMYISPVNVEYVVELLNNNVVYGGMQAESLALEALYSAVPHYASDDNVWCERLKTAVNDQKVVLRAVSMQNKEYIQHLKDIQSWEKISENTKSIDFLSDRLSAYLWVVEVSLPQLFPANERKLGEIVLDASRAIEPKHGIDLSILKVVRIPGRYLYPGQKEGFIDAPSSIGSHTPVISK